MKKIKPLVLLPIMAISLTSCSEVMDWNTILDVYVQKMDWRVDFNILQLTDIHWNVNTSTISSKTYLDKVFKEVDRKIKNDQGSSSKIDLVELTGDQFMLANTYHVKTFVEYFETKAVEYGFKYAIIWGNHDRHGLYSPNWLADQYRNAAHAIYIEPEDNLYGRSNFVININDGANTKWQIYNLDSGASFSESPLAIGRNYDYIRKEQTEWYKKEHIAGVSSIAYYHIPQQDNQIAWKAVRDNGATNKHKFFRLEGFGDADKPEYASDFISEAKNHDLKAAFMGHAHNNDWTVEYEGVVLGLGVKTGPELYFAHLDPANATGDEKFCLDNTNKDLPDAQKITEKFDLIGASLVTLKSESDFDLEHLYLNEKEGADDYIRWVKW